MRRLWLPLVLLMLWCAPLSATTLRELSLAEGDTTALLIQADTPLTFSSYWLSQPTRLVIEFAQTRHSRDLRLPSAPSGLILKMSLESPPELGGGTRLTLVLADRLDAQFATEGQSLRLTLRPFGGQPAAQDAYARAAAREAELKRQALQEETARLEAEHRRAAEEKARLDAAREEEARRATEEAKAREAADAEKARLAAREAAKAREAAEAEKTRLADEAARAEEARRLALEAETRRAAQEAEARRMEEEKAREEAHARAEAKRAEAEKARAAAEAAESARREEMARQAELARRQAEQAREQAEKAQAEALARHAAEEKARLAEAARQAKEAEHLRSLRVTKLSSLATLQRLGFQGHPTNCLVWAEFSQPVDVASEWPDDHTLLVSFSPARIVNRINTYPLDTQAFGSLVTYIQPDFDPSEKRVTFRLRLTGRTPLTVEKNGGRVELRFGTFDTP